MPGWTTPVVHLKPLQRLHERYGSPIHIHSTSPFEQNVEEFLSVGKKYGIDMRIFYARKANRSTALVDKAVELGIGIDSGSLWEIEDAIERGVDPSAIIVTSPCKDSAIRSLCQSKGVLPILDNADELREFARTSSERRSLLPVGVRLSGFRVHGRKLQSRFGFDVELLAELLHLCQQHPSLRLVGFQFHLDGYCLKERAAAFQRTVEVSREFRRAGYPIHFIDIGGGFTVRYLKERAEWRRFLRGVEGQDEALGGRWFKPGVRPSLYPFYPDYEKGRFLEEILRSSIGEGTVAEVLRQERLELRIEPGRALLDGCGITIARVGGTKNDTTGERIIILEMNSTQLKTPSDEYCLDPLLVSAPKFEERYEEGYLAGNSCMEGDLILKRRLRIPKSTMVGDYVIFSNTAGYFMHLFENSGHSSSLPANLLYEEDVRPLVQNEVGGEL